MRIPIPSVLTAVVGVTWAASASPASAQVASVYHPYFGRYNFARFQTFQLNLNTPYGPLSFGSTYYGSPNKARQATALASSYNPYTMTYGYLRAGAGGAFAGNPQLERQQKELARAQRRGQAVNDFESRSAIADQTAYERGAKPTAVAAEGSTLNAANRALLAAAPGDVASGKALNDLLAAIRPLDEKTTKPIDSSLLPPDLAGKVLFAGSASADALNLLRAGPLAFPEGLKESAFDRLRAELDKAYTAMTDAPAADRAAATRLLETVQRARESTADAVRELSFADASAVARFFNRLEAAAQLLTTPATAAAYVPNWSSIGLTVRDLCRHMTKFHLTFGPAAPGDEDAYEVVHRAMVSYYVALTQPAK